MSEAGDATTLLRRYLEQRRELGERELALDDLDVNEVLRLVGARTSSAAGTGEGSAGEFASFRAPDRRAEPAAPAIRERTAGPNEHGDDWRSALRAAGADPSATTGQPRPHAPSTSSAAGEPRNGTGTDGQDPETASSVSNEMSQEPPATAPAENPLLTPVAGGETKAKPPLPLDRIPVGIEVGGDGIRKLDPAIARLATLNDIADAVQGCRACSLYATATHAVPGEGNPKAGLVCVGEAPGANEDATGRPFVGRAGELLTRILAAINLRREDVFICNVLKHRPPGNRNPLPIEVAACSPYLLRQLQLIQPRVVVAWGTFAAQTLLETKLPIGKLRGQIHRYYGIPLVVTYHPAALLRNSAWKRPTWEDVQLARRLLDNSGT